MKLVLATTAGIALITALVVVNTNWVSSFSQPYTYDTIEDLPENEVGLVLGTSPWRKSGGTNYYFEHRMNAAAAAWKAGKVKHLLVSGDNATMAYNEPVEMQKALIKRGVPIGAISLDYAGFRTLDSVVRARKVFGQREYTIFSQAFHNERAVFIAQNKALDVVAFNAKDVSMRYGFKVELREYLARVKMLLDLFVINKQPKFLGDKIEIK